MNTGKDLSELTKQASSVDDCGDVYFVPAFGGLFSPYWKSDARGLLIGFGMNTKRAHITRAMLEAPCLRTKEVLDAMQMDSGVKLQKLFVDGGMTVNNLMMQMQADFSGLQIIRKS
eukprot:CAMPEP_0202977962 /NCGR_PEP_ID=MMETSP1396-20130829/84555_1 /ASSEMBLY_ACC=CAM_ASM_000872 /TAXON_ID= /ORGANISM="Pseudokeronopsis sp., Strain Brazil" /LENGTH=115 /DNA_ID=CAMNT_0049716799 /DNA_START=1178 /DNA_END=1525 /DNA_ORIENTATION=-